mgnify:CR=1 FL=1
MSGALLFIGKFLLGVVLLALLLVSLLNLYMRVTTCYEMRQDPFFPYNPETSFDEWIAYKKICRDPIRLLVAIASPVFFGYSIYSLIKKKSEEKDG